MAFERRTEPPTVDIAFYRHTGYNGGLNECIVRDEETGFVLPNCVGYAWGRWYEVHNSRPNLSRGDAETWYEYNDGYERSQVPNLGSVICWKDGPFTGLGHVAFVEAIEELGNNEYRIITTNSDYSGSLWYEETLVSTNGYQRPSDPSGAYEFQGFILNPDSPEPPPPPPPTPVERKKLSLMYYLRRKRMLII